jgi:hypothetical protein
MLFALSICTVNSGNYELMKHVFFEYNKDISSHAYTMLSCLELHKENPKRHNVIKMCAYLCKKTNLQVLYVPFINFNVIGGDISTLSVTKNNLLNNINKETFEQVIKMYLKILKKIVVFEENQDIIVY